MNVAIVAHFDPSGTWDDNFIELLRVLGSVVERGVIVTTGEGMPDLPDDLSSFTLVRRHNVGYDFYSYRVGIRVALEDERVGGVFLLNSSLYLVDSELLRALLRAMSDTKKGTGARGLTSSSQFGWHLQSYLLYFDLRYLPDGWLQSFFERVEPVNSKFEVVLKYEIGLGRALQTDGIAVETFFRPGPLQRAAGALSYMRSLRREHGRRVFLHWAFWRAWRDVNWAHFGAASLARCFGIVKAEFIRGNPHRQPQEPIWSACEPRLRPTIERALVRTSQFYVVGSSGLTELSPARGKLGILMRSIDGIRHSYTNARVAVVVHLFYLELFDEILDSLENIVEPFDLYVTTPFEADVAQILDAADRRRMGTTVLLTRNLGRDVGPFIALYRTGRLDKYDAVLKVHSKKSRYSDKGDLWRKDLLTPLCGNSLTVLRSLRLIRESGCGIVGPERYFLTHEGFWGANRERLKMILTSCGMPENNNAPELAFFAGTMFWFAPSALSAIHRAQGEALDFEPENGLQDGTLAHAWERTFCLLARAGGYRVSSSTLNGQDLFALDASSNRVLVLGPVD